MRIRRRKQTAHWPWPRRIAVLGLANLAVAALASCTIELVYRLQPVDFWRAELRRDNPELEIDPDRPRLLVLGDSFSASPEGLAAHLRDAVGDHTQVIGSGVSGMTARDARVIAPARLRSYRPDRTVYQVYVGNDLLETSHPPGPTSWSRRLYWTAIDAGWRSLAYLNYRLGQVRDSLIRRTLDPPSPEMLARAQCGPFDPTRYSARTRRLLSVDPALINDQVLVQGWAQEAWRRWIVDVRGLVDRIEGAGSRAAIVVVPHCVQVHPAYLQRYRRLGAEVTPSLATDPSIFVSRLRSELPGATILDPLEEFRATSDGWTLYRLHDPHLTHEGQELLTTVVTRWVSAPTDSGTTPSLRRRPASPPPASPTPHPAHRASAPARDRAPG